MAMKSIALPRRSELQLFYPKLHHNGFGYTFMLKTGLTIGRHAFGIVFFGFGIGFCYDLPGTLYGAPVDKLHSRGRGE